MAAKGNVCAVQDQQGRLKGVNHFSAVCASFLACKAADQAGLDRMHRLFELEAGQFQQGLSIYAHKAFVLQLLKQTQCLVLKGSASTGQSLLLSCLATCNNINEVIHTCYCVS